MISSLNLIVSSLREEAEGLEAAFFLFFVAEQLYNSLVCECPCSLVPHTPKTEVQIVWAAG